MAKPTIVVVEDNEDIRGMLHVLLAMDGNHVVTCDDGVTAHACIVEHQPQLVILDGDLPGRHGIEAFQHLQADPQTRAIPVIFFTAQGAQVRDRFPPDVPIVVKPDVATLITLVEQTIATR